MPKNKLTSEGSVAINYTVTDKVDGYTATNDSKDLVNTHGAATVDVAGSKTWDDSSNQDGKRPTSIKITLTGTIEVEEDGNKKTEVVKKETKTVTADDNWSWSWTGLYKFAKGKEVAYTISEEQVPEYETPKVTGYNVKNTHKPETVVVSGKKTWSDDDNRDGLRPKSIEITLTGTITTKDEEGNDKTETVKTDSKTVTEVEGNWTWTWENLPKYKDGKEIKYVITEGKVEYYKDPEVNGYDVINTHNPFETQITVIKNWDDSNNQDGLRPESVQFVIVQDDVAISDVITLDESNNWSYTVTKLPRKANGKDIKYSVKEVSGNTEYKQTDYQQSSPSVEDEVEETNANQVESITVTNSHTPKTTEVIGQKNWEDDDDRDGKRPESISVTLTGTVEEKDESGNTTQKTVSEDTKIVKETDGWKWSWTDLPAFNNGKEITYSVSEASVSEYTTKVNDYDITNTHEIATTTVTGTKVWNDDGDRDGKRPETITINVKDGNTVVKSETVSGDNISDSWSYTISGLPKYKDHGKTEINYTVEEVIEGTAYTSKVEGTTITNTHEIATTTVTGTKVWNDDGDRDGKRPETITINAKDGNTIVKSETVSGDNISDSWSYTISGLPKYKDHGKTEINYTVEEVIEGTAYTSRVEGTTIINTHVTQKVDIPVSKTWVDNNDSEKHRPTEITVNLLADGEKVDTATITKDGNWTHTFEGFPKYKNHGTEEVKYTVEEIDVDKHYDVSYPTDTTIVNTIKDLSKDIPIRKVWDDADNQDGKRPETITIVLKGTVPDEKEPVVTKTLTLSKENVEGENKNSWADTFKEVPIFHKGTWITYNVEEQGIDNDVYTQTGIETGEDGVIAITNSHTPELKDIIATKAWEDNEDNDGLRPESVTIALMVGEEQLETAVATPETNWQVTFKDYPVYENGEEIEYTVTELNVDSNYEMTDVSVENVITNTHEPATITYKVTKNWEDFDNNDGKRPESITVNITGTITEGEESIIVYSDSKTITENEDGLWTYSFENLPKYKDKQLIQYTITEDNVDLYTTQEIRDIETTKETTTIENEITNVHDKIPYNETGEITVNKYWYDENDKYKKRPGSITVNLLADDEIIATAELNKDNGWSYTFTGLDKYTIKDGEVGVEIKYSIQEVAVENYKTTIKGFDITNTYNGPVPEITPPNTGVMMKPKTKRNSKNNSVLFEMIATLLTTSYTIVVARKNEQ